MAHKLLQTPSSPALPDQTLRTARENRAQAMVRRGGFWSQKPNWVGLPPALTPSRKEEWTPHANSSVLLYRWPLRIHDMVPKSIIIGQMRSNRTLLQFFQHHQSFKGLPVFSLFPRNIQSILLMCELAVCESVYLKGIA